MTAARRLAAYRAAFGAPRSIHVTDHAVPALWAVTDSLAQAAFKALDATNDNWNTYAGGGFKAGQGLAARWTIQLNGNPDLYLKVSADATTAYVEAYTTRTPTADANGQHFGLHPIHVFSLRRAHVEAVIDVVQRVVGMDTFPSFDELPISAKTPTAWRKAVIAPVRGAVNLRCVPSTQFNDPVAKLDKPTNAWVIRSAYRDWAQVSVGGVCLWVHEDVVTFE